MDHRDGVAHEVRRHREQHAPSDLREGAEPEAEEEGEDALLEIEVKNSEREARHEDGDERTESLRQAGLQETAEEELLGEGGEQATGDHDCDCVRTARGVDGVS